MSPMGLHGWLPSGRELERDTNDILLEEFSMRVYGPVESASQTLGMVEDY